MKKFALLAAALLVAIDGRAGLVGFDLKNDSSVYSRLDDRASGSVTNNGVIVTLTASDGVMNRTASGFGINAPGTDDTDALNSGQYIDLVFGADVVFSSLTVSSWGSGDQGQIQYGPSLVSSAPIAGTGETVFNIAVAANETLRIAAISDTAPDNGFSLDGFTVAVPEPAVLGLMGIGSGLLMLGRRRR
jgi:hypothetical protein